MFLSVSIVFYLFFYCLFKLDIDFPKNYNVKIVKNALKALPSGTKTTVCRITGLSVATCNTILNKLDMIGEILEVSSRSSSVRRTSKKFISLMKSFLKYLATRPTFTRLY